MWWIWTQAKEQDQVVRGYSESQDIQHNHELSYQGSSASSELPFEAQRRGRAWYLKAESRIGQPDMLCKKRGKWRSGTAIAMCQPIQTPSRNSRNLRLRHSRQSLSLGMEHDVLTIL